MKRPQQFDSSDPKRNYNNRQETAEMPGKAEKRPHSGDSASKSKKARQALPLSLLYPALNPKIGELLSNYSTKVLNIMSDDQIRQQSFDLTDLIIYEYRHNPPLDDQIKQLSLDLSELIRNGDVHKDSLHFDQAKHMMLIHITAYEIDSFKEIMEIESIKNRLHENDNELLYNIIYVAGCSDNGDYLYDADSAIGTYKDTDEDRLESIDLLLEIPAVREHLTAQDNRIYDMVKDDFKLVRVLSSLINTEEVFETMQFAETMEKNTPPDNETSLSNIILYGKSEATAKKVFTLPGDKTCIATENIDDGDGASILSICISKGFNELFQMFMADENIRNNAHALDFCALNKAIEEKKPEYALILMEETSVPNHLSDEEKQETYSEITTAVDEGATKPWFNLIQYPLFRKHWLSTHELRLSFVQQHISQHPTVIRFKQIALNLLCHWKYRKNQTLPELPNEILLNIWEFYKHLENPSQKNSLKYLPITQDETLVYRKLNHEFPLEDANDLTP